jgi:hypothetical protein
MLQVLEDFLTDDVQYNWVQMFRVQEPLRPVFDSKAQDSMKTERLARSSHKVCYTYVRQQTAAYVSIRPKERIARSSDKVSYADVC